MLQRMLIKVTPPSPVTAMRGWWSRFGTKMASARLRMIAAFGRIDERGGQLDAHMVSLLRAKGRRAGDGDVPQVRFESTLALGDAWALGALLSAPIEY